MIESGFEKEQRQRNEMFARWGADSALFKANIGKPSKSDARTSRRHASRDGDERRARVLAATQGDQAAATLNAVHASAQVEVQGETA